MKWDPNRAGPSGTYPNSGKYYPGLWWGALGSLPAQMWLYMARRPAGACGGPWKTMLVPAKLDYN